MSLNQQEFSQLQQKQNTVAGQSGHQQLQYPIQNSYQQQQQQLPYQNIPTHIMQNYMQQQQQQQMMPNMQPSVNRLSQVDSNSYQQQLSQPLSYSPQQVYSLFSQMANLMQYNPAFASLDQQAKQMQNNNNNAYLINQQQNVPIQNLQNQQQSGNLAQGGRFSQHETEQQNRQFESIQQQQLPFIVPNRDTVFSDSDIEQKFNTKKQELEQFYQQIDQNQDNKQQNQQLPLYTLDVGPGNNHQQLSPYSDSAIRKSSDYNNGMYQNQLQSQSMQNTFARPGEILYQDPLHQQTYADNATNNNISNEHQFGTGQSQVSPYFSNIQEANNNQSQQFSWDNRPISKKQKDIQGSKEKQDDLAQIGSQTNNQKQSQQQADIVENQKKNYDDIPIQSKGRKKKFDELVEEQLQQQQYQQKNTQLQQSDKVLNNNGNGVLSSISPTENEQDVPSPTLQHSTQNKKRSPQYQSQDFLKKNTMTHLASNSNQNKKLDDQIKSKSPQKDNKSSLIKKEKGFLSKGSGKAGGKLGQGITQNKQKIEQLAQSSKVKESSLFKHIDNSDKQFEEWEKLIEMSEEKKEEDLKQQLTGANNNNQDTFFSHNKSIDSDKDNKKNVNYNNKNPLIDQMTLSEEQELAIANKYLKEKLEQLDLDREKFKLEMQRVKLMRTQQQEMLQQFNKQKDEYNTQKIKEIHDFELMKEEEMKKLRAEKKVIERKMKEKEEEYRQKMQTENQEIEQLNKKIQKLQDDLQRKDWKAKTANNKLGQENEALISKNEELEETIQDLHKQIKDLNGKLKTAKQEKDEINRKLQEQIYFKKNLQRQIIKNKEENNESLTSQEQLFLEQDSQKGKVQEINEDELSKSQSNAEADQEDNQSSKDEQTSVVEEEEQESSEDIQITKKIDEENKLPTNNLTNKIDMNQIPKEWLQYKHTLLNLNKEDQDKFSINLLGSVIEEEQFIYNNNDYYKKYMKIKDMQHKIINQIYGNDGRIYRTYENGLKEITFPNGGKKETFPDGYQIVHFANKDIKQNFPEGIIIYYFSDAGTTQTTFPNGPNVYRFNNKQIEVHFTSGHKEIKFPDGTKKFIQLTGEELTYFSDGTIQKIDNQKIKYIEYQDGKIDIIFPDGSKVREDKQSAEQSAYQKKLKITN